MAWKRRMRRARWTNPSEEPSRAGTTGGISYGFGGIGDRYVWDMGWYTTVRFKVVFGVIGISIATIMHSRLWIRMRSRERADLNVGHAKDWK